MHFNEVALLSAELLLSKRLKYRPGIGLELWFNKNQFKLFFSFVFLLKKGGIFFFIFVWYQETMPVTWPIPVANE